MIPSAVLLVALIATGLYYRSHRTKPLTGKDTILLADFSNSTGDPIFDGTLKQALAVKLGESPFLNIVSDERVRQSLREMEKPPEEKVSGAVAREVCQRQSLRAMLEGAISSLGSRYVLFLEAVNCQTGDALARVQVEAQSKEGVSTVICNTEDFDIGRRVCAENWQALRAVGESANRALCEAEAGDARPAPDVATFSLVTRPSTTEDGCYAPGLRFGEPRVVAVLGALVGFAYLVAGFANRQLVERVGARLQAPFSCRQATYDLRRLKRKTLIEKIPHAQRYRLTSLGRQVAVLFTKVYGRVLAPGLTALDPHLPADLLERSDLSRSWRCFDRALDTFIQQQMLAA